MKIYNITRSPGAEPAILIAVDNYKWRLRQKYSDKQFEREAEEINRFLRSVLCGATFRNLKRLVRKK